MSRKHWRLTLRQIREILRLREIQGLSFEKIGVSCRISKTAVRACVKRAAVAGLTYAGSLDLDETELEKRLYPISKSSDLKNKLGSGTIDWQSLDFELKRKGVTKHLLWEEMRVSDNFLLSYSQFCRFFRAWKQSQRLSLRFEHKAGERLFVDFAGTTLPIYDLHTPGVIAWAQVFVATWGASSYSFAMAVESQTVTSWIKCHVKAFDFFGCTPEIVVTDNLKAGVSKVCRYDPQVNPTYQALADHYKLSVLPARSKKPKDKAKVEGGVCLVTRWILAVLRHRKFFSLAEANEAIAALLEKLNGKHFQKKPFSRSDLFEKLDRPAAKSLPDQTFEIRLISRQRVNIDYHVVADDHYYSVPHRLRQKEVTLSLGDSTLSIFHGNERVALHMRNRKKFAYTTLPEHRPPNHQAIAGWSPERIIDWAGRQVGENAALLCEKILLSRSFPEYGYRAWLGINRLSKQYGRDRAEAACSRALELNSHSYKTVKKLLEIGPTPSPKASSARIGTHENIRGGSFFSEQFLKGLQKP